MPRKIWFDSDGSEVEELEEIEEDVYVVSRKRTSRRVIHTPVERSTSARITRASTAPRSTRASSVRSNAAPAEAGPSRSADHVRKGFVAVEIPYMPFTRLKQYAYASGLKPPTTVTRSRTIAAQDGKTSRRGAAAYKGKERERGSPPRPPKRVSPAGFDESDDERTNVSRSKGKQRARTTSAQPSAASATGALGEPRDGSSRVRGASKGNERESRTSARNSTRSTSRVGYGDEEDDEAFSTGPSEADFDSDDSLLTRRLRPGAFEPRRTRAQRREEGTPPSEQPRYTRGQASVTQQTHWQTADKSPEPSEYEQSEGESEIDDMDELESDLDSLSVRSDGDDDVLRKHRPFCEKCREGPADELLAKALKRGKKRGRKRKLDIIDQPVDPVEHAESLEGWIECERCCVAMHWGCLSPSQQKKLLAEIADRNPDESRRRSIGIDECATFTCSRCEAYPVCYACEKSHIKPARSDTEQRAVDGDEVSQGLAESRNRDNAPGNSILNEGGLIKDTPAPLLFRCDRCKQAVHYEHLRDPFPPDTKYTVADLAKYYQSPDADGKYAWDGPCCREWKWHVDRIIAWRPLPADAEEPPRAAGVIPGYRERLPREYLVKWKDRGFRHLSWVPHAWLTSITPWKLRNFLHKGPQLDLVTNETLAAKGDEMSAPTIQDVMDDEPRQRHREVDALELKWEGHGPPPDVDAEASIPTDWSTADRVLDVYLLPPQNRRKRKRIEDSDDEEQDPVKQLLAKPREDGVAPPPPLAVPIVDWELRTGRQLTDDDIEEVAPLVTWALIKWQNLQYDEACYDTPPAADSPLYPAFKTALKRYLAGRQVTIPILSAYAAQRRDAEAAGMGDPPEEQPECVRGGTLMPFQLEGLQWLIYKYFRRESCILADDMGLGKTIQVASFLGYLRSLEIYPSLVIVPNSTITNWVREIEKWVPDIRVVPYFGDNLSRKRIADYELYHPGMNGKPNGFKAHVILTTYESFMNNHSMFKAFPRWESIIVDEGQRMKSDSSLLFARLKSLHSVFRVLLTGTPLNNNLRELFNLLNFLDPKSFRNLKDLESRFENLNENLLQELHELISPYILRRVKRDVLKLPPKVEIIIPIAMTTVQKQVTREILHVNMKTIEDIVKKKKRKQKNVGKITSEVAADFMGDAPADSNAAGPSGTGGDAGPSTAANGDAANPPQAEPGSTEAAVAGAEPEASQRDDSVEVMDVDVSGDNEVLVADSQPAASQPHGEEGRAPSMNGSTASRATPQATGTPTRVNGNTPSSRHTTEAQGTPQRSSSSANGSSQNGAKHPTPSQNGSASPSVNRGSNGPAIAEATLSASRTSSQGNQTTPKKLQKARKFKLQL